MSTPKAKSSAVAVSLVAVLAAAAMVATPLLAAPAYGSYVVKNPCEKDPYSYECKKFCKEYPKDPKCPKDDGNNNKKYPVCHNGKQIYVGSKNAQYKHIENHGDKKYCPKKPAY
jgi:hypothetical protein